MKKIFLVSLLTLTVLGPRKSQAGIYVSALAMTGGSAPTLGLIMVGGALFVGGTLMYDRRDNLFMAVLIGSITVPIIILDEEAEQTPLEVVLQKHHPLLLENPDATSYLASVIREKLSHYELTSDEVSQVILTRGEVELAFLNSDINRQSTAYLDLVDGLSAQHTFSLN